MNLKETLQILFSFLVPKWHPEMLVHFSYSGPEGTCFEGGVFPAKLIFPPDYPLSPPKMQFTCEMFHPNSMYFVMLTMACLFNIRMGILNLQSHSISL